MSKASSRDPVSCEAGTYGDYVILAGSWVPAGIDATAPTGALGGGFTVTQSASGVFNIAFTNPYKTLVSFVPGVKVAAETTDATAQWGDVTAPTATAGHVVRLRTMTGGTPTDFSGDAAPVVSFVAVFARR